MKMKKGLFAMALGLGVLAAGSGKANAQLSGATVVSLLALDVTAITATPTVAISPIADDYSGSNPSVTGLLPILLTVTSTRPTGVQVRVSGQPAAVNGISNDDLRLRSATPGSQFTSFTPVSTIGAQPFWQGAGPQVATVISVDTNIQNLVNYPQGLYTNTLTWTAVPQ